MRYISLAIATILGAAAFVSAGNVYQKPKYPACGGHTVHPHKCSEGQICIDDPYKENSCGMACDIPGICVEPVACGGIAGTPCKEGTKCFDDPRDQCDPKKDGADCIGICV